MSDRCITYRRMIASARDAGVTDAEVAEVIVALGPNPEPEDLAAALDEYLPPELSWREQRRAMAA